MSDNLQPQGNFGIQDTVNMGSGDAQLLNDLMAPETASGSPETVEPIIKETEDVIPATQAPKGKDIIPPKSVDGKTDEEKQTGESLISDFLSNDPDAIDEEEVEIDIPEVEEPKDVLDEVVNDEEAEVGSANFEALSKDLFDAENHHHFFQ